MKKLCKQHKERISKALTGRKLSEETKKRMGDSHRNVPKIRYYTKKEADVLVEKLAKERMEKLGVDEIAGEFLITGHCEMGGDFYDRGEQVVKGIGCTMEAMRNFLFFPGIVTTEIFVPEKKELLFEVGKYFDGKVWKYRIGVDSAITADYFDLALRAKEKKPQKAADR